MSWIDFFNGYFQVVHDVAASAGKVCIPTGTTRTDLVELYESRAAFVTCFDNSAAVSIAKIIMIEVYHLSVRYCLLAALAVLSFSGSVLAAVYE